MTFPSRKEIGDRLQELRVAAGYASANEFADALGFNRGTYTGYEQGKGMFSYEKAWTMADALQCSMDELGGREWPSDAHDALSADERSLVGSYRKMDPPDRDKLRGVAETFVVASEKDGAGAGRDVARDRQDVMA